MTELEAPLMDAARQLWSDGDADHGIVDAARARFERACGTVEQALAGASYLVGGGFSVADIVTCGVLSFARTSEVATLPAGLVAYVDGLEARPARVKAYSLTS